MFKIAKESTETVNNTIAPAQNECLTQAEPKERPLHYLLYLLVGIAFGIVFVKAEIVSWYRIQEMFRLQSFHMYGVIGTAIVVGLLSVQLIKKIKPTALNGASINILPKTFNKGQIFGGLMFGLGWGITGACPGPLYAQIGAGFMVVGVTLVSAVLGTWCYGALKNKLPH